MLCSPWRDSRPRRQLQVSQRITGIVRTRFGLFVCKCNASPPSIKLCTKYTWALSWNAHSSFIRNSLFLLWSSDISSMKWSSPMTRMSIPGQAIILFLSSLFMAWNSSLSLAGPNFFVTAKTVPNPPCPSALCSSKQVLSKVPRFTCSVISTSDVDAEQFPMSQLEIKRASKLEVLGPIADGLSGVLGCIVLVCGDLNHLGVS
mmetsp:Transcript_1957/g.3922  ORF Transcript_1957/g.3922 Transcript_1957/m.3922 type:complete len:203 (-) Transcript_1957:100-708(-)